MFKSAGDHTKEGYLEHPDLSHVNGRTHEGKYTHTGPPTGHMSQRFSEYCTFYSVKLSLCMHDRSRIYPTVEGRAGASCFGLEGKEKVEEVP